MNTALKNKKPTGLLFCAVAVLLFFGCQTIEETISQTHSYDYGARYYNPAIGRFIPADPQAEKYPNISPYAYCAKDTIYIDLKEDSLIVRLQQQKNKKPDNGIIKTIQNN